MDAFLRFDRAVEFFTSMELLVGLLWTGVGVFAVALIVLMHSRWGQSRPLRKCLVLSLLAHLLLAGYATTVQIVGNASDAEPVMHVSFVEGPLREADGVEDPVAKERPWDEFRLDAVPRSEPEEAPRPRPTLPPDPQRQVLSEPANLPDEPSLEHLDIPAAEQPEPETASSADRHRPKTERPGNSIPGDVAVTPDVSPPERRDAEPVVPQPPEAVERPPAAESALPPLRTPSDGIPTTLLAQLTPPPRLDALPSTREPADAVAALTDRMSRASAGRPAERIDRHEQPASVQEDTAYAVEKGTDGSSPETDEPADAKAPAETDVVSIPRAGDDNGDRQLPKAYQLRVAPDRLRLAERMGATPATEAAVKAALTWLADNQNPRDGRWDAGDHGAGKELLVAGRNRYSAGIQADSAVTGLALLSFLASGHTHQEGRYRENVRRGVQYLLTVQAADGNLGGAATAYAKMYCHAMAAFALSEAYAMTDDPRLRQPVLRAVNYTLAAQEPVTGGWRYKPGDPGDTSQCGWQLMALKSAELAGIPMPVRNYNGMVRYLRSAASGQHGGLSAYRPGERVSRTMTAEALVCWKFLGMAADHPAAKEAGDYLLEELPGSVSPQSGAKPNFYYWYYATLAMHQLQGAHWRRWNEALRPTLLDSQLKTGPMTGSWDPDTVWGGYGGRVYSTAMATLCLEVYYRFLPLYVSQTARRESSSER